ncbi:MAG: hypothetical protein JO080_14650 [Mucilaginibacter sp.]|nr:hypothetical protein [Mucilaginibacter sp.]
MKSFRIILATILLSAGKIALCQTTNDAVIFHIQSSHTAFPDTGREKGHVYDKVLYSAAEHYHDSTVLIIAPKKLNAQKTVDLIFWFHGWRNNVDNAAGFYELTKQFIASNTNAVLILAETAKDSPDSYGASWKTRAFLKR